MVQFPAKVKNIIDSYLQELNRNNIPIKEAVLFGSYANGHYQEWSDIDIALVSDIFEGNLIDDKDKIRKITLYVQTITGKFSDTFPVAPRTLFKISSTPFPYSSKCLI